MDTRQALPARFVFGPFEAVPQTGELHKHGIRIRLSSQPFQILLLLLQNTGEVVSREQLREKIWGDGTFVDFEHSLNAAINKLRRALGDSGEDPRYVQTVVGRGYRFIGTIEAVAPAHPAPNLPSDVDPILGTPDIANTPSQKRWRYRLVAASLVLLVGAGSWLFFGRSHTAELTRRVVVLSEAMNVPGDSALASAVHTQLAVQLERSASFRALTESRVRETLRYMRKAPEETVTPEMAREVCERVAGAALIEGSIAKVGEQFLLELRARDCNGGEVLSQEQAQLPRKEDLVAALGKVWVPFERHVRAVLPPPEQLGKPLTEATTSSLEALKSYDASMEILWRTGAADAAPLLKRAVELDPLFALAHSHLGRMYSDLGEPALAVKSITTAYRLRKDVSDRENFFITYNYHREVTRNLELARETCESWLHAYPKETAPHAFLSGFTSQGSGRYQKAIDEARKAIALSPNHSIAFANVVSSNIALNRLPEAEAALKQVAALRLELPDASVQRYFIAFLRGDQAAMDRESAYRRGKEEAQGWYLLQESLTSAYRGQIRQAKVLAQQSIALARQAGLFEKAATAQGGMAVASALAGELVEATQAAGAALQIARGRDADYGPAFALALAKHTTEAEKMTDDLERRYPEDTSVRFNYLPSLRALAALNRNQPEKAVELSLAATPYEFAATGTAFNGFFGSLYAVYVRGLAYAQLHQYREAIEQFRKILDHPGIVLVDPVGALTRLQLARAFAACGENEKAKAVYRDFLALWKDADPDLPVLLQAKAEFAKL